MMVRAHSGAGAPVTTESTYRRQVATRTRLLVTVALLSTLAWAGLAVTRASASAAAKKSRPELVVRSEVVKPFGRVLVDAKGYALYTYASDSKNHSNCVASCLSVWPALVVAKGARPIGRGVGRLGDFRRSDGAWQVTYAGRPLYTFTSDARPNEVSGNGVGGFHVARVGGAKAAPTKTVAPSGGYGY